jgi:hypothetical protein
MLPAFDFRSHHLVTKERREPDIPAQGQPGIVAVFPFGIGLMFSRPHDNRCRL